MAVQTVEIPCTDFAVIDSENQRTNYHGAASYTIARTGQNLRIKPVLGFDTIPEAVQRHKLTSVDLRVTFQVSSLKDGYLSAHISITNTVYRVPIDEETITDANEPWSTSLTSFWPFGSFDEPSPSTFTHTWSQYPVGTDAAATRAVNFLKNPYFYLYTSSEDYTLVIFGREATADKRPILIATYDDENLIPSQITTANAPTSGYVNPRVDQSFSWGYTIPSYSYVLATTATQASATFYWRAGTSGAYTAIPISGSTTSVTIPANTFPTASTIQWYVSGTDTLGSSSQTPVYTLSTAAGLVTATPVSPIGAVEDGSAAITLIWSAASNDGFPQNGADLQTSRDGSTWTDLASVTGTTASYEIAADTFTAGAVYWRVRGYNIDGVAGSWSAAAQFVVVAAPPQPSVTVEAVPFATVNWQVEGQQAYKIAVDGTVYGPYFGQVKTWTVPDYLTDGEHTITVEVQGVYGLWSQPGSASFTVQNQPGAAVTLSGEFERDADLSWATASQTADFLIYRDDVQIGHTSAQAFTDRFALGEHSYQVINRLPDGNYTASNIVTGTMLSCVAAIAPLTGGSWIELTLSENSNREEGFVWTQAVSMRHFAGAEFPVAEQSPFADLSGSYDVAFKDVSSAKAFEQLRGQAVVLKSRGGNVMIGILSSFSKRLTEFYIPYTFTLQRMHWRDWIDADSQL